LEWGSLVSAFIRGDLLPTHNSKGFAEAASAIQSKSKLLHSKEYYRIQK